MKGTFVEGEPPNRAEDPLASHQSDEILVEKAEFDWPEYLPAERIKAGLLEMALGFLLFAALVVFCSLH